AECVRLGAAFLPYFPLASGLLTGKYRRGEAAPAGSRLSSGARASEFNDERMTRVEALRQFAEARGHTLLQLAFSWLLARTVVASVIAGATSVEQVRANIAAASWELKPDEIAEIDRISA
ncbi:MAG: aldo/keto reductase, partial [Gemmatimonadota bacterium]|nr:aldo/keto reductase [Gemmatimonadota bacterium]